MTFECPSCGFRAHVQGGASPTHPVGLTRPEGAMVEVTETLPIVDEATNRPTGRTTTKTRQQKRTVPRGMGFDGVADAECPWLVANGPDAPLPVAVG